MYKKGDCSNLPTSASFLLTENCNLACKYCFEKHNTTRMTKEVAREGINYLCFNAMKKGTNEISILIFGGEPTLELELLEYMFEYALEMLRRYNLKVRTSMITNAMIFNDKLKKILVRYKDLLNLNVQLSIDGAKLTQDMYRVKKDGTGSFGTVSKNVNKYTDIFKDNRLSIHGCVNKQTLKYLFENYKFFKYDWGFKNIWFLIIHEELWDDKDVEMYREQLGMIYDDMLIDIKKSNSIDGLYTYAPIDRCLNGVRSNKPCGAGTNFVTITASGDIYPCHHFYFNDPSESTKIGDVYNGIDDDKRRMFLEYSTLDLCDNKCECANCYRCIAANWVANGAMLSQIKGMYCKMSAVEREIQEKMRKSLISLGFITDNNDGTNACRCNVNSCTCNIDNNSCACNIDNNSSKCGDCDTKDEIFAKALNEIILQLDELNNKMGYVMHKIIK